MALIDKISEAIKASMKEKDTVSLESLRAIKSALLLAQTQKGNPSGISVEEEIKIFYQEVLAKQYNYNHRKHDLIFLACVRKIYCHLCF